MEIPGPNVITTKIKKPKTVRIIITKILLSEVFMPVILT